MKAVFFDLDGTLLPMDYDKFMESYFKLLVKKMATMGYDPDTCVEKVWKSVGAMVKNDGSMKNEDAFWTTFTQTTGEQLLKEKKELDEFYKTDFMKVQEACGYHPAAKQVVDLVKIKGLLPVLATNPLFPEPATRARMNWAGLCPDDFALYTTYENSSYCKPNLKYYECILERIGCKPEECVMVGNDVQEDMIAKELGMKVFLLTDCLINKTNEEISGYAQGGFEELLEFIREL